MDWLQIKKNVSRNQVIELLDELDGYGIVFEDEDLVKERLKELGYN